MFQDVEIIEDDEQVIEISDEEDCKVLLEIVEEEDEILLTATDTESSQNQVLKAERTQHLNKSCLNNCISSEGNSSDIVIENVTENEIKQENSNISNDNLRNGSNLTTPTNNSVTKANKSKKRLAKKRRRRNLLGAVSKEVGPNNTDTNGNDNSANSVQREWRSINTNLSAIYDFSKLKWLKPLSNLSTPPHLQMVIIDRNHPYWRMENDKWLMVEKRLLEALNTEMIRTNDPSIGLFDGAKWQRGIKIVGCHNKNAFNFIMEFVIKLDKLWNGAQLDAFPITHINRHVVKAYIPPPTIKTELIMSLIKLQNPSLNSSDWKVLRERERAYNSGMDIWLSVNDESFTQLSSVRGEIKFGINRIFLSPSR